VPAEMSTGLVPDGNGTSENENVPDGIGMSDTGVPVLLVIDVPAADDGEVTTGGAVESIVGATVLDAAAIGVTVLEAAAGGAIVLEAAA